MLASLVLSFAAQMGVEGSFAEAVGLGQAAGVLGDLCEVEESDLVVGVEVDELLEDCLGLFGLAAENKLEESKKPWIAAMEEVRAELAKRREALAGGNG